jgi:hypothetical protein
MTKKKTEYSESFKAEAIAKIKTISAKPPKNSAYR